MYCGTSPVFQTQIYLFKRVALSMYILQLCLIEFLYSSENNPLNVKCVAVHLIPLDVNWFHSSMRDCGQQQLSVKCWEKMCEMCIIRVHLTEPWLEPVLC